jgi:creatinine amidohydrolase
LLWHEQSWPRIQSLDKDLPVVIPLASIEQHGRHLPLIVDTSQVQAIADAVERKINQEMLLLPTLWLGSSHHHKDYPGTISVTPGVYSLMIQDVARSVIRAGFKRILFLNGHGGNRVPASQALNELVVTDDVADDTYLTLSNWWEVAGEAIQTGKAGLKARRALHADEIETSMMLFLRPDLVFMKDAVASENPLDNKWFHFRTAGSTSVEVIRRFARFTSSGVVGDAKLSTRTKGRRLFDLTVNLFVELIRDYRRWPTLKQIGPRPSKRAPGRSRASRREKTKTSPKGEENH